MSWTANIDTVGKNGSSVYVQVTYSSSEEEIRESYNFDSPALLKSTIKNKIKQLEDRDAQLTLLKEGSFELEEDIKVPHIEKDLEYHEYFKDFKKYLTYLQLINSNILQNTNPEKLALEKKLKNTFKSRFVELGL